MNAKPADVREVWRAHPINTRAFSIDKRLSFSIFRPIACDLKVIIHPYGLSNEDVGSAYVNEPVVVRQDQMLVVLGGVYLENVNENIGPIMWSGFSTRDVIGPELEGISGYVPDDLDKIPDFMNFNAGTFRDIKAS